MLLRQLEYLTALARERHFGRAADACYVSQPALSASIRKLEADLGVQIVQRGRRFEGFTAEGLAVLDSARRMLAEHEELGRALEAMRHGLTGRIRIGAVPTALTVASLLTTPMRTRHPLVQFSLESMTSRTIETRLNEFEIDVGMTYIDGEPLGRVRLIPLYRERYVFVTPLTEQYADRQAVTWAEVVTVPLCLLLPRMQNRRILDGFFTEAGVEAEPIVETDTVSAIYAHISSMGLSSVVPHAWIYRFGVPDGARMLTLPRPHRTVTMGLVLPGGQTESLLARALVDVARQVDMGAELDRAVAAQLAHQPCGGTHETESSHPS